jgi:hypothetical protein
VITWPQDDPRRVAAVGSRHPGGADGALGVLAESTSLAVPAVVLLFVDSPWHFGIDEAERALDSPPQPVNASGIDALPGPEHLDDRSLSHAT